jgi:hypothetical protein
VMSALPPKADIGTQSWNVRFVPKADSCTAAKKPALFDGRVAIGYDLEQADDEAQRHKQEKNREDDFERPV